MIDLRRRIFMLGSALSQGLNVGTAADLDKTGPNESVSARMHRQDRTLRERLVNAMFFWQQHPPHCERAYLSDVADAYALIKEHEQRP